MTLKWWFSMKRNLMQRIAPAVAIHRSNRIVISVNTATDRSTCHAMRSQFHLYLSSSPHIFSLLKSNVKKLRAKYDRWTNLKLAICGVNCDLHPHYDRLSGKILTVMHRNERNVRTSRCDIKSSPLECRVLKKTWRAAFEWAQKWFHVPKGESVFGRFDWTLCRCDWRQGIL